MKRWLFLLQLTVSLGLLARGWLTWQFDHPLLKILWNEEHHQATSPVVSAMGILLMLLAVTPWLIRSFKWSAIGLVIASALLFVDALCRFYEKDLSVAMLVEMSLQWVTPLALFWAIRWSNRGQEWNQRGSLYWIGAMTVAIALTFIGHGWFAIGFSPVPPNFLSMTMELLRCSETFARHFLQVVGFLDFIAAIALFLPVTRKAGLLYMIVWGGATALARLLTIVDSSEDRFAIDQALAETLVRTSHWMMPLLVYCLVKQICKSPTS